MSVQLATKSGSSSAKTTICVQGLGFVGAANAIAIANANGPDGSPLYDVIGIELPNELGEARAAALREGVLPFTTTDESLRKAAQAAHKAGSLTAGTDASVIGQGDIVVVNVGLDLLDKDEANFAIKPFRAALTTVGQYMRPDALVLLESTIPPGTCEQIAAPLLRECLAVRGLPTDTLNLAYCYERVMPGDGYLDSITNMWRVYAGLTPQAADMAEVFLKSFIDTQKKPLRRLANIRSAEMAKVLENTYRAVNIALIDEWEHFARKIGVDLFEVLEAIRVRPTHNNIRYPGLGVGGYCLSKDPLFGPTSARTIFELQGLNFPLSRAAVAINDAMPLRSVQALEETIPGGLKDKRVLILGASYRQDVGDTRYSPSAILGEGLAQHGARVEFHDPMVEAFEEMDVPLHTDLPSAADYDIIVFAVAHREFKALDLRKWLGEARPFIFDSNGVLSSQALTQLADAGFKVGAIGRGLAA